MANSETDIQPQPPVVDFSDTKTAFAHKNDSELKKTAWLFKFMNKAWFVKTSSAVGLWLNETGINIFNPLIKETIFWQFCGGTSLEECGKVIDHLYQNKTYTVLDYGVEGKSKDEEFDQTVEQIRKTILYASKHTGVPLISIKVTSMASNELLEKHQSGKALTAEENSALERVRNRVDLICKTANENGIAIFIDAEETWIQDPIDELAKAMMEKYNRGKVVAYQTYQMYRKDKLDDIIADHQEARSKGYILGAKIVRGAYMEKERKRAIDKNYPSPIQDTKEHTDRDFDKALTYLVNHHDEIASCNATHNLKSNLLQAELISKKGLPKDHPHLSFCQLYGMSDNITFNLAAAGYNVAKIVPYGPVKEVVPYLIRRAKENTSVTGEMSRELNLVMAEMKRRGLK